MHSAMEHPEVVREYLTTECALGRMLGPFSEQDQRFLPQCHISRFGVIPKGHNTGRWRLITDLSYPPGESVNDGIEAELCSLVYTSIDQVARVAAGYQQGALLAKVDIEAVYRLIPVHPADRPLQATSWEGKLYIDPMLPFGLRSAPKLFNAVADALEWYLEQQGIRHIYHYLDDFIVVGPPDSLECAKALTVLDESCAFLGIPLASHKRDGPTTCLTFLGIEVDTAEAELRLPGDKLQRLSTLLQQWADRKTCSRRELESLVGLLNHACKVIRVGRSFLRRMLDLLHAVPAHPRRPHPIRLNREFRSDRWRTFVQSWNGISYLTLELPVMEMASDASGSWGCGAWHLSHWFQWEWDDRSTPLPIMVKELFPIILAAVV